MKDRSHVVAAVAKENISRGLQHVQRDSMNRAM